MKKAKFQIQGLHCRSCVILIEEKLKTLPGVIEAKVGLDSQRAVVMYDETKTSASAIQQTIETAGDYSVQSEDEEGSKDPQTPPADTVCAVPPTKSASFSAASFTAGFFVNLSLISLLLNAVLLFVFLGKDDKVNLNLRTTTPPPAVVVKGDTAPLPPQKPSVPSALTAPAEFAIKNTDHIRGNPNAKITLVEFSDFECPFCARHKPTLDKILSDYQGKARLVYKHYPLGFHPNAQKAAEASECASEQGKFWEYHDKIFENQATGLSLEKFSQWAQDLKLDAKKFNNCLTSGQYAQKIKDDAAEGAAKGVSGTPATFVNGESVVGAVPFENFKQILDKLL